MKTIAILRPSRGFTMERFGQFVLDEERAVWRAQTSGELREILYNTSQFGSMILIFETATIERAKQLASELPLVANGLFDVELLGTRPYDGLAHLFRAEEGFKQNLPAEWQQPAASRA
jgi:hypothetical protein